MRSGWVYQMHWRSRFWEDMTDREAGVLDEHDRYIGSLHAQGLVILAGAIEDPPTGLVLIAANNESDARAIVASDPCVVSEIVDVTLHEFSVGYVGADAGYDHLRDDATGPADSI
jgi:uncharacterized protein YciI